MNAPGSEGLRQKTQRELGQRLRAARKAARITVRALARELDVTEGSVTAWESGKTMPRPENVEAFARVVGVDDPGLLWSGRPSVRIEDVASLADLFRGEDLPAMVKNMTEEELRGEVLRRLAQVRAEAVEAWLVDPNTPPEHLERVAAAIQARLAGLGEPESGTPITVGPPEATGEIRLIDLSSEQIERIAVGIQEAAKKKKTRTKGRV
jgi:transcriptional regulator with XRE-family HTH domain